MQPAQHVPRKQVWGPHLIVVPTSVLMNWVKEFKKWAPGVSCHYERIRPFARAFQGQKWASPEPGMRNAMEHRQVILTVPKCRTGVDTWVLILIGTLWT